MPIFYSLVDPLSPEEKIKFNVKNGNNIRAILAHEHRYPKAGEWYLSGAIPEAYKAPNDLSHIYHICRLVKVKRVTRYEIDYTSY